MARFLLILTHGAGGTVEAPDLLSVRDAALHLGGTVARVIQPYRVRGARAPGSAVNQDVAWAEAVRTLRDLVPHVPLVQGGRSNGARVACRTATEVGAQAVIALAFPLRPPQRSRIGEGNPAPMGRTQELDAQPTGGPAARSATAIRLEELHAARSGGARVLVVNGERDPFGVPGAEDADQVVVVPGETHALKGHRAFIVATVTDWLRIVL